MPIRKSLCAAAAVLVALLGTAGARAAVVYSVDDGTAELGVGLSPPGGSVFFANRFTAVPGGERIEAISVAYGLPGAPHIARAGTPVQLLLFRDAQGRSTPGDPELLASAPSQVTNPGTNTFHRVAINPTVVAGDFFVGVMVSNIPAEGPFPISFDTTSPRNRSVAAFYFTPQTVARLDTMTYDPSRTSSSEGNMDTGAFVRVTDGNFMVRAEGAAVPEPSAAGAAVLAAGALALRRGRRGGCR